MFGEAKPVDTAAREREIEEKLEREKQEKIRAERERREKEREAHADTDKKDVIMIQTESSRRRGGEGETNWRKRDDAPTNGSSIDNKTRHMGGNSSGRHMGRSKNIV